MFGMSCFLHPLFRAAKQREGKQERKCLGVEICLCGPATPTQGRVWVLPGAGQAVTELLPRDGLTFHQVPLLQHKKPWEADRNPLTMLSGSVGTYQTPVQSLEDLLCGLWASQVSSMSSEDWRPWSSCCQPACSCWDPLVITKGRWHELLYKGFEISRIDIKLMEIKFLP